MENFELTTLQEIPSSVVKQATRIIFNQDRVPLSPVTIEASGRLSYCAAASLAKAGLEMLRTSEDVQTFDHELMIHNLKATVVEAFVKLGWSRELCIEMQYINDSLPEHDRRSEVLRLLSR